MNGNGQRPLAAALLVGALGLAACGGSDGGGRPSAPPAASTANQLDPPVGGREILRVRRIGVSFGTSDIVKYGSDGSAVIVQAYGGGGERIQKCRLHAGGVAQIRRDLELLPLGKPAHVRHSPRPTFYSNSPTQYTLWAGRRTDSWTKDAMPSDARPFVKSVEDTMRGRIASCHETFRTRRS